MSEHFADLEQRLIEGYQAQLRHYDRALVIVAQPGAARLESSVHELNAVLRGIADLDADLAEDKTVWRFSGCRPGPDLSAVLEAVTERIRALSAIVDRGFADLQASKQALMPQIDETIQQRRMLHAYGKSS